MLYWWMQYMVNAGQLQISCIQDYNFIFFTFYLFFYLWIFASPLNLDTVVLLPEYSVANKTGQTDETQQKQCLHSDANIPSSPVGHYSMFFPQFPFICSNKYLEINIFQWKYLHKQTTATMSSAQETASRKRSPTFTSYQWSKRHIFETHF